MHIVRKHGQFADPCAHAGTFPVLTDKTASPAQRPGLANFNRGWKAKSFGLWVSDMRAYILLNDRHRTIFSERPSPSLCGRPSYL